MVHLALDRDQWRIHVDTIVKLRVLKREGIIGLAERLSASKGGPLFHGVSY
jgi:hypothetical protein